MATRGRHAPFRFKHSGSRWERSYRMRRDFPASDEDEDRIIIGPGTERESGTTTPLRG